MLLRHILVFFSVLLYLYIGTAWAKNDPLSFEQAFTLSAKIEKGTALFHWTIADGYYLYRKKIAFVIKNSEGELGTPDFPKGTIKQDEYLGEMEIYRTSLDVRVPFVQHSPNIQETHIEVSSQGCADFGFCYPPHQQSITLYWPLPSPNTIHSLQEVLVAPLPLKPPPPLPSDEAFRFFAEVKDAHTLAVHWQIAKGYYLYREKFAFTLLDHLGVQLGTYAIPSGQPHHDEEFGEVQIFRDSVDFLLPLVRTEYSPTPIRLQANFQGCAEQGICYPPIEKTVILDLPAMEETTVKETKETPEESTDFSQQAYSSLAGSCEIGPATGFVEPADPSQPCKIADALKKESLGLNILSFLGMGILLAFTPCVFPMIPILSGIIVGHGRHLTASRAFLLSLSYVLASALTYTVFGILAGLFGANLQTFFQEPQVIIAFSALFIWLALSMFGIITFQMPSFIQARMTAFSHQQTGGTLAGAAVMGALSALIVGPCVAAPLAGTLIYISQTGDALLGGIALFSIGIGMGSPLLIIGASAGRLLPRAGTWMNAVKAVFGVGLLGIAVWLLDRVVSPAVSLFLWALLLIIPGVYLGALDPLPPASSGWHSLWKGVGVVMVVYGTLLLVGVASNATDPLQPLREFQGRQDASHPAMSHSLVFRKVRSLTELKRELADAEASGRWAMLDFYADWCVSCKEMERYTFSDSRVEEKLQHMVLLKADVTQNSDLDKALMNYFGIIGPPAILFFGSDQLERKEWRVIGYMETESFLAHLQEMMH